MKTAAQVSNLLVQLKEQGKTKEEMIVSIAEACMGWSYVWGGAGQYCTAENRRSYADRSTCPAGEAAQIRKLCQIIKSGAGSCSGCKWYPGGKTRFFDCRGFTRWVLQQTCDWTLQGAGCTSQWNNESNWKAKGTTDTIPDGICLVFKANGKTMEHTGIYVGGGRIIHCSGTVKEGKITDRGWTHWGIPVCLDGEIPDVKPTLKRGSKGPYVTLLQTKLIQLGYSLPKYGADGSFGAETEAAVKAFQRDNGLEPDGIVGAKTYEALDTGTVAKYTVTVEHLSKTVAEEIVSKYGGVMAKE